MGFERMRDKMGAESFGDGRCLIRAARIHDENFGTQAGKGFEATRKVLFLIVR